MKISSGMQDGLTDCIIITAGSTYLDIDAYACCVALKELLELKGENAIAYSAAACNYSVCESFMEEGQITDVLPQGYQAEDAKYIIVDVSDPEYIKNSVPLDRVIEIYDHHAGFEEYWSSRIGEKSQIEYIGAAATLIYRQWKEAGLQDKMTRSTVLLLIAAILDNTLNLTSANTTPEDIEVFNELCRKESIGEEWCASYFQEVQTNVEDDLKNALFGDLKTNRNTEVLPPKIAQICVWDSENILAQLPEIRQWFEELQTSWMMNIIDLKQKCSYFVCNDMNYQKKIGMVFDVQFHEGIAKLSDSWLRKEIIKKANVSMSIGG